LYAKIIAINADKVHPPIEKDSWGRTTTRWKSEGHLRDLIADHKKHKWAIAGVSELGALGDEIKPLRAELAKHGLGIKATDAREGEGNLNKAGAAIIYDQNQVEWVSGSTNIVLVHRIIKGELRFKLDQ